MAHLRLLCNNRNVKYTPKRRGKKEDRLSEPEQLLEICTTQTPIRSQSPDLLGNK